MFAPSADPLTVTLLVLPDCSLMSLAATLDPLRAANRIAGRCCYRYRVVSADGRDVRTTSGLQVRVDGALEPDQRTDVLVVLAAFGVFELCDASLMHLLSRAARNAGFVGGIEAGAWVLALAGLLNGRRATTHWEDLDAFAEHFPEIEVVADRFVVDGRFFTTGGAAPALDFLLSLIAAREGTTLSLDVASLYVYDGMRTGADTQPSVSLGRLQAAEPRLARAIKIMEAHIDAPLSTREIARRTGVSPRTLESLFVARCGAPPARFYRALRLNAARRLIVDTRLTLAETAVRCGFSSVPALSRAFKRHFGLSPRTARDGSKTRTLGLNDR